MSARERVLALRLLEKQRKNPKLAKQLGIDIAVVDCSKKIAKMENCDENRKRTFCQVDESPSGY